jgi:hypothetical protein
MDMAHDEEPGPDAAPDGDMEMEEEDADVMPRVEGGVAETETIESLVFVTNPDYPYPFKVEKPPRFWMDEQTGVLQDAVETYMDGDRLNASQLAILKIYLKQFVERAPLAGEANVRKLVQQIQQLRTTRDVEDFADEIAGYGAEVF